MIHPPNSINSHAQGKCFYPGCGNKKHLEHSKNGGSWLQAFEEFWMIDSSPIVVTTGYIADFIQINFPEGDAIWDCCARVSEVARDVKGVIGVFQIPKTLQAFGVNVFDVATGDAKLVDKIEDIFFNNICKLGSHFCNAVKVVDSQKILQVAPEVLHHCKMVGGGLALLVSVKLIFDSVLKVRSDESLSGSEKVALGLKVGLSACCIVMLILPIVAPAVGVICAPWVFTALGVTVFAFGLLEFFVSRVGYTPPPTAVLI